MPDERAGLQRHTLLLFTLAIWLSAGLLQVFAQDVSSQLLYNRSSLAAGDLLGAATGHLVHVGWMHYLLNMAGLTLILFLFEEVWTPGRLLGIFIACTLAVDAGLWWASPQVLSYAGLSGILHGLLGAGALLCWRGTSRLASLVLLATVTKLVWEQYVGPTPGMREITGAAIIVDSHLYGFAGGVTAGFVCLWWLESKSNWCADEIHSS